VCRAIGAVIAVSGVACNIISYVQKGSDWTQDKGHKIKDTSKRRE
jgi:hypothetical protein